VTHLPECIIIEPPTPCRATVIWLHGLGADGHDFEPIVPELGLPAALGIRFVFPHAPHRPVSINGGYVMRAWYDISHADLSHSEDDEGIRASSQLLWGLIDREVQQGIAADHIVVAGFSQGGAIALHGGLRYEQPLAGLLILSSYLPLAQTFGQERVSSNESVPIMMMHGKTDTVIPIGLAESSRDLLTRHGQNVTWKSYPMAHSLCGQQVGDISRWLAARLG